MLNYRRNSFCLLTKFLHQIFNKKKTIKLNIKKISVAAMKSSEYEIKTGTANTEIKIEASFCVVDIKD